MEYKVMVHEVTTYWYLVESESPEHAVSQVIDNPGDPVDISFSGFTGTIECYDRNNNLLYEGIPF